MAGDIVTAVKYIREHCASLGIDKDKICLYGCSGGGYAQSAACSAPKTLVLDVHGRALRTRDNQKPDVE